MKCHKFKESNTVIAEGQDEYNTLQGYRAKGDPRGTLIICWQLSWKERLILLFTGKLWHYVLTFNQPLQPIMLDTGKPPWLEREVAHASDPIAPAVLTEIYGCAACGADHAEVLMTDTLDSRRAGFSHSGICPKNGQVLYANLEVRDDE